MIEKIVDTAKVVDNGIMFIANKSVSAYNWTTGGTKANLANGLLTVAPIMESSASYEKPALALINGVIWIFNSHVSQERNLFTEERESRAMEGGMLDYSALVYTNINIILGYGHLASGIFISQILVNENWNSLSSSFFFAGQTIRAASHFVMRTDYLPPKKNILSRTKDKLTDLVESYRKQPELSPILLTDRNYLSGEILT